MIMRLKINFDSGLKINFDLKPPKYAVVKSKKLNRQFIDLKEAVHYSMSLDALGIDNTIKLHF